MEGTTNHKKEERHHTEWGEIVLEKAQNLCKRVEEFKTGAVDSRIDSLLDPNSLVFRYLRSCFCLWGFFLAEG